MEIFGGNDSMSMSMVNKNVGNTLNFVVLGETQSGKTSLLNHYCYSELNPTGQSKIEKTLGMTLHTKKIIDLNSIVIANFYDFCGRSDSREDLDIFLKLLLTSSDDADSQFPIHGVLLVFDVSNKRSLESLPDWLIWFQRTLITIGESQGKASKIVCERVRDLVKNIPVFVIGNKLDKISQKMSLTLEEISSRAENNAKFQKAVENATNFLRRNFALVDFDNLLFLSKEADPEALRALDDVVMSVFERDFAGAGSTAASKLELGAYTIERCLGWRVSKKARFNNGLLNFVYGLFKRDETVVLPLYATRSRAG